MTVRLGADDVNWLALVRIALPDGQLDAAEGRIERLAEEYGREYDGDERDVRASG